MVSIFTNTSQCKFLIHHLATDNKGALIVLALSLTFGPFLAQITIQGMINILGIHSTIS